MKANVKEVEVERRKPTLFDHLGLDLREENRKLESLSAEDRVAWTLDYFKDHLVLSSSFGAQSAVSLHLAISQWPDIPVILVDTGYLFPETYRFVDELVERLKINLQVCRPELSSGWQEARYGKLWEQDLEGIEQYNKMNKVVPMNRAFEESGAQAWLAGLRRNQSRSREKLPVLAVSSQRLKIHPIIDWTDRDVHFYLKKHDLPYHPLWHEGYLSIGDIHTSHKVTSDMSLEDSRFFGLKRECGLHDDAETDYAI
ncbi:MAG TPA: phosphoadenylyl-sulfate reductase [Verrucomicrobiales bacterium]|nr:phosphoadenylyl-sulfate reductase [Verrucomicrobiales bacterium]HIL71292.1 phosphoadenylyl-sulfate reductase [Verrucomicrobiota bacterium]